MADATRRRKNQSDINRERLIDDESSLRSLKQWIDRQTFPNQAELIRFLNELYPKVIDWYEEKFEAIRKLRALGIINDQAFETFKAEHRNCAAELAQAKAERDAAIAARDAALARLAAIESDRNAASQSYQNALARFNGHNFSVSQPDLADRIVAIDAAIITAAGAVAVHGIVNPQELAIYRNMLQQTLAQAQLQQQLNDERTRVQQLTAELAASPTVAQLVAAQDIARQQQQALLTAQTQHQQELAALQAQLAALQAQLAARIAERDARPTQASFDALQAQLTAAQAREQELALRHQQALEAERARAAQQLQQALAAQAQQHAQALDRQMQLHQSALNLPAHHRRGSSFTTTQRSRTPQ